MKIAQIVSLEESVPPKSKNGLEFIVSWLTEELIKRGHDVTLFAPANSKTNGKLISITPKHTSTQPRAWGWNKNEFSIWNTSLVASLSKNFDIIHSHTGTITSFMPFINKPVIQTLHEPYRDDFRQQYLNIKNQSKYFKFAIDQYKKINYVCISKKQESNFLKCQKYYFKKHQTIHNGIPIEEFDFNKTPKDYLFFIGYLNENKGADTAVQIARQLKMKLILAGESFGQENFFNKKIKPYLNKDIKYIGPIGFKEKNNLYKNALATLTPINWHEPFGLTLVESQACGTPVISFNKGASSELIQNNHTGFVVENKQEMIKAVKKIKTIDRKKCRDWVEENFSIKKMVDDYEKLYKKTIKK